MQAVNDVPDFVRIVGDIEARYPVNSWIRQNVHLWPLVRFFIVNRLNRQTRSFGRRIARFSSIRRIASPLKGVLRLAHRKGQSAAPTSFSANGDLDCVFLSYPTVWSEFGGNSSYDRLVDPLIEELTRAQLSSARVNLVTTRSSGAPANYRKVYDIVLGRTSPDPGLPFLRGADPDTYKRLRRELSREFMISLPSLEGFSSAIEKAAKQFAALLLASTPKFGLTPMYSNFESLAFILACRRLGIKTVDLQHGVVADFNAAYAGWNDVPPEGYEVLPDLFMCWSEKEAAQIRRWGGAAHSAVAVGNPWLNKWKNDSDGLVRHYGAAVGEIKQRIGGGRTHVLCTLQNTQPPDFLIDAIRESIDRIVWWIRLHPRFRHEQPRVEEVLGTSIEKNVLLDEPTNLPLPALLRNLDGHVTEHSSVISDAYQLGMPSVTWSDVGMSMYAEEVEAGAVVQARRSAADILRCVLMVADDDFRTSMRPAPPGDDEAVARALQGML